KDTVRSYLMGGFVPVTSTAGLIDSWTYTPPDPTTNIPQQALPLGMNLWCFETPPSNGQEVEIDVRDFQSVPEGAMLDAGVDSGGAGGAGGAAGSGGAGGQTMSTTSISTSISTSTSTSTTGTTSAGGASTGNSSGGGSPMG